MNKPLSCPPADISGPPRKYFGTDGIRGCVGEWPVTPDCMLHLGYAAGRVLGNGQQRPLVLIGKDTRVSGYMFESALEAGLVSAGADVRLLGPLPTPAVSWLTRSMSASAGIVISASHNPYTDNGVKFFGADGEKLADQIERDLETMLEQPLRCVASRELGKVSHWADAIHRYAEFCLSTVGEGFSLRGRRLVLDCAHGATYQVAPQVFAELGAEVQLIGAEPNGFNINAGVGSTYPQALSDAVRAAHAELGIAFDGDGDRVMMVDHRGRVVDGDDLLYILACSRLSHGHLQGPVVGTVMSNHALDLALRKLGVEFLRAPVGDRNVRHVLCEHGGLLGGETSGHLLCLDRSPAGDGLIAALAVLEALQSLDCALDSPRVLLHKLPQRMINVPVRFQAEAVLAAESVIGVRNEIEQILGASGRVVLRASGTEPLVRVTIEGLDAEQVQQLAERLAIVVRAAAKNLLLKEERA